MNERYNLSKDNASLSYGEVVYFDDKKINASGQGNRDSAVGLRYSIFSNYGHFPKSEWDKYRKERKGFYKKIIWYYEKEFRIVIQIKDNLRKKLSEDKTYKVCFTKQEQLNKKLSITFGPMFKDLKELSKFKNLNEFYTNNESKAMLNKYIDDVDLKLCDKCKKNGK